MKVKQMKSIIESNKFDNIECNFELKSKGPNIPEWFKQWGYQFEQRINKRFDQLESRIDNVEKSINARIDNLVSKNNLKE